MNKKLILGVIGAALVAGGVAYGVKSNYESVLSKVLKEKNLDAETISCSVGGNCTLTKVHKDDVVFDKVEIFNMSDIPNVKDLKDGTVGIKITGIKSNNVYFADFIKNEIKNSNATDDAKKRMIENIGQKISFYFSSTIKTGKRKHISYNSKLLLGKIKATGSFEASMNKNTTDKDVKNTKSFEKVDLKLTKLDIGVNIPEEAVKAGIYLLYTNEIGSKKRIGYSSNRAAKITNRNLLGEDTSKVYPYSEELFKKVQDNIKKQKTNSKLENKIITKLADAPMKGFNLNIELIGRNGGLTLQELGQIGYKIRSYGPKYAEKAISSKIDINIK